MRPSDKLEQPSQGSSEVPESKVARETQSGKQDLVERQRGYIDSLKGGAHSGITDEFGKPLLFDGGPDDKQHDKGSDPQYEYPLDATTRSQADTTYGSPADTTHGSQDRVAERTAQNTAEVRSEIDFATYSTSADTLVRQAQGHNRDAPFVVPENSSDPSKGNLLFYQENDGRAVAVNTGNAVVQDVRYDQNGNPHPFFRPVVTFDSKSEVYDLGDGKRAIVQYKPMGENTMRPDIRETLPTDSYSIILLDQKEGKAYRYPAGASLHKYEDGSNLRKTLEVLKGQGQPGTTPDALQQPGTTPDALNQPEWIPDANQSLPAPEMQPLPAPDRLPPAADTTNTGPEVRFGNVPPDEGVAKPEGSGKSPLDSRGNAPTYESAPRGGREDGWEIEAPPIEEQRESLRAEMDERRTTAPLNNAEETALDQIQDAIVSGDAESIAQALLGAAKNSEINIESVIAEADRSLESSRGTIFTSIAPGNSEGKTGRCICIGTSASDKYVTFDLDGRNPRLTKVSYRDPVTAQVILANEQADPAQVKQTLQQINSLILNYHWTSRQFG